MKANLAKIITFLFDPGIIIPLFLLILIFKTGLTQEQVKAVLPLLLLFNVILPGGLWFVAFKSGQVSDWEMSKRAQRVNLYLILSVLLFCGTAASYFLGNKLMASMHLIFSSAFFLATLITLFWKISIHMLVDTLVIIILNFFFFNLWFLYLLLPIIAWSRYVRHKHTPLQLLAGFSLSVTVTNIGFRFFGYL